MFQLHTAYLFIFGYVNYSENKYHFLNFVIHTTFTTCVSPDFAWWYTILTWRPFSHCKRTSDLFRWQYLISTRTVHTLFSSSRIILGYGQINKTIYIYTFDLNTNWNKFWFHPPVKSFIASVRHNVFVSWVSRLVRKR
jgi:hypothetical protein